MTKYPTSAYCNFCTSRPGGSLTYLIRWHLQNFPMHAEACCIRLPLTLDNPKVLGVFFCILGNATLNAGVTATVLSRLSLYTNPCWPAWEGLDRSDIEVLCTSQAIALYWTVLPRLPPCLLDCLAGGSIPAAVRANWKASQRGTLYKSSVWCMGVSEYWPSDFY